MLRIAARYADTWNSRGTVEEIMERNSRLTDECHLADRDPSEIKRSLLYVIAHSPEEHPWDSVDAFTDYVGRYADAGIEEFIFQPPNPEQFPMLERIAQDVIPGLRESS
jgi:alkanesulfonate monooxygenase SsuD/methylene tetrahydromethanopterin reductase-like flavin-dependent oxidoreductase (luciferase family)